MERPIREDFEGENSDHITDWLYETNRYCKALEKYIDSMEKQLLIPRVSNHVCECTKTTQANKINDSWICTECNRPIQQ